MSPTNEQLAQIVQTIDPGGKLRHTWPLTAGISAEMTGLEIELPDGGMQKRVVRRFSEGYGRQDLHPAEKEFRLLQITHAAGLPTPKPYILDTSRQILPTPYLVIEFVEGEMVFAPPHLESHLIQLATQLAQIHRINSADFDLSFLGERVSRCAELSGEPTMGIDPAFDEAPIRVALASRPLADSQTRQLALSLLHGDFWPGNSLWQGDQLVAVIDWEDAELGGPLVDLARSRSEIAWIFGLEAMNHFTAHYQALMSLDLTHLPYWDLCAALRFLRLFGADLADAAAYFTPFGRSDITPQTIRADFTDFVNQALTALTLPLL